MIFKKRRRKKETGESAFDRTLREIKAIDDWDDRKKIEHYILDSCEQIVSLTKEIEGEKAQIRIMDSYLEDTEKISALPPEKRKELSDTASKVVSLERSRSEYQKSEKKISDADFLMMQENEEIMPDAILRMQDNEKYYDKIRREMAALEGEKAEYEYELDENREADGQLKKLSIFVLVAFAIVFSVIIFIDQTTRFDASFFFLIFLFLGAVIGIAIFLRQSSLQKERRKLIRQLNQSISLLNVIRVKYASIVKAVESQKERYNAKTAYELNIRWERYLEAVREKNQYLSDNDDLEYYSKKLMRLLSPLKLYDRRIWLSVPGALIKQSAMENVKKNLLARRSKIVDAVNQNRESVLSERDEINRLMKEHDYYVPEILEIITSVDRLCGMNTTKAKKG